MLSTSAFVPKSRITLEKLRRDLIFTHPDDEDVPAVIAFEILDVHFKVPLYYGMRYMVDNNIPYIDKRSKGESIHCEFRGALREKQTTVINTFLPNLYANHGGVLVLPCGFGKTTLAIYIASLLKRKTLIIVNTTVLMTQWAERIEQFTGLEVSTIQGKTFDTSKSFCIGMIQTLYKDTFQYDLSCFGLLIVDESHHLSSRQFYKCTNKINAFYRIGLSATPDRKDGCTDLLYHTLGPIGAQAETVVHGNCRVYSVLIDEYVQVEYIRRRGEKTPCVAKMITNITENMRRSSIIVSWILKCAKVKRKIIVLADRLDLVRYIGSLLPPDMYGLVIGKMNEADVTISKTKQVLLGTYAYVAEGFDLAALDTCILATPRKDIIQSVGRILRLHPTKRSPLIIDILDNVWLFKNQYKERRKYYVDVLHASITDYVEMEKKEEEKVETLDFLPLK
jgi:superfamily II DNA or RNA helicase